MTKTAPKDRSTPRTDAYLASRVQETHTKSWLEFARELEWELAALLEKRTSKGDAP